MKIKQDNQYEYIPFGPEWEKEMMKFPKKVLIDKIRSVQLEKIELLRNADMGVEFDTKTF